MTAKEYLGDWADIINVQEADRILRKLSASNHIICPQLKNSKDWALEYSNMLILGIKMGQSRTRRRTAKGTECRPGM